VTDPAIQHRSGGSNRWATPRPFAAAALEALRLPAIALDLAAEASTALAPRWYGPGGERADALDGRVWDAPGGTRWCNPPYSRQCRTCPDGVWRRKGERPGCAALGHASTTIDQWVEELCEHGNDREAQVSPIVALVPANTDTGWWAAAMASAAEVWFVTGRLRFLAPAAGGRLAPADSGAGFGSALLMWDGPIGRTGKRWVPLRFGMLGADGQRVEGSRHGHGPRGST
jgi:hypothetical protein